MKGKRHLNQIAGWSFVQTIQCCEGANKKVKNLKSWKKYKNYNIYIIEKSEILNKMPIFFLYFITYRRKVYEK